MATTTDSPFKLPWLRGICYIIRFTFYRHRLILRVFKNMTVLLVIASTSFEVSSSTKHIIFSYTVTNKQTNKQSKKGTRTKEKQKTKTKQKFKKKNRLL